MSHRTAAWYAKPSPTFVDAIALVRRHLWLASEGFSLSEAEPDIWKVPAVLYHRLLDSSPTRLEMCKARQNVVVVSNRLGCRKISGGTRSERGSNPKMTLASLFGTWRAQRLNPLAACRQLLSSP